MNVFPRPRRLASPPANPPAKQTRAAPPKQRAPEAPEGASMPSKIGTAAALIGILATAAVTSGTRSSILAHQAAIGVALSIAVSAAIDAKRGIKSLIRADILALVSFYFLTLWEFLFPQPMYDAMASLSATTRALWVVEIAFAGMLVGRHLVRLRRQPFESIMTRPPPISRLLALFWIAVFLGYFYMLACSGWNPITMTSAMMDARFSQPWQRGQLGDWRAAFSELALLLFLIPALGGVMLARRDRYSLGQLVPVGFIVAYTLFYGFASGTRNLFGTYLVNFLIGFAFATPQTKRFRLIGVAVACALAMVAATYVMLQFRTYGFKRWLANEPGLASGELQRDYMFVDYNLLNMSAIAAFFPSKHDYLGLEIPYIAVIHPIPRFLWPGKPIGPSVSIEDIMGYDGGITIAATFAGEAYISGGFIGVFLIALGFGAFTGWWNHFASPRNSEVGILIYATGFLAAVISMRSMFVFTTSLLPAGACIFIANFALPKVVDGVRKLAGRPAGSRMRAPKNPTLRPPPQAARGRREIPAQNAKSP